MADKSSKAVHLLKINLYLKLQLYLFYLFSCKGRFGDARQQKLLLDSSPCINLERMYKLHTYFDVDKLSKTHSESNLISILITYRLHLFDLESRRLLTIPTNI